MKMTVAGARALPASPRRPRASARPAALPCGGIEPLERRDLFSIDLLPFFDYITLGDKPSIPGSILQGTSPSVTIPMIVQNSGSSTEAVPANTTIGVQIFARPAGAADASQDILVNKSAVNLAIGGLGISGQKKVSIPLNVSSLPFGSFDVVMKIDTSNAVPETDENNNIKVATNVTLDVDPASSDLAAFINAGTKLPTGAVISDGVRKIPIKLDINNTGNTATAASTKVNVSFVAHRTSDNADIALQTFNNVSLGALQAHKGKTLTFNPVLPLGLASGDYTIAATVTPTAALAGDDAGNNTATTTGAISVTRGFYDLSISMNSTTLPLNIIQGNAANGVLNVWVTNQGNVALPKDAKADFRIRLRPDGVSDNLSDVVLGDIENVSIANLGAGKTKSIPLKISAPNTAPAGSFFFVGAVLFDGALVDDNPNNNLALSGEGFLTIGPANPDLVITTATNFTAASAPGGSAGTATVTVKNQGTANSVGGYTVTYYATTANALDDSAIVLGSTTVNTSLGVNKTTSVKLNLAFPNPDSTTNYNIFARITAPGTADANTANNTTILIDTISISHADLAFAPAVGQTFKFSKTQHVGAGPVQQESGDVVSSTGITGKYNMTIINGVATFAVTLDSGPLPGFGGQLTFTGASFFFGGRTLNFSRDPLGAKASFLSNGTMYIK
jgi:hypothetical protein